MLLHQILESARHSSIVILTHGAAQANLLFLQKVNAPCPPIGQQVWHVLLSMGLEWFSTQQTAWNFVLNMLKSLEGVRCIKELLQPHVWQLRPPAIDSSERKELSGMSFTAGQHSH